MFSAIAASQAPKCAIVSELDQKNLWESQLQDAKAIAKEAGKKILEIRNLGQVASNQVTLQNEKVVIQTNADLEASQQIIDALSKKYPHCGILSQDHMNKDPFWHLKESVWIINPIDGTKAYENGKDDFHIQIGFLHKDEPVLGMSYYPATDTYIWAIKGQGAWRESQGVAQKLTALPSQENILIKSSSYAIIESHFNTWNWVPGKIDQEYMSSTTRLLKMIEGKASLYISLGSSPQGTEKKGGVWNYGANVVIANEAGLMLKTLSGNPLNLREPNALLVEGIVLTNDQTVYNKVVQSDWQLK